MFLEIQRQFLVSHHTNFDLAHLMNFIENYRPLLMVGRIDYEVQSHCIWARKTSYFEGYSTLVINKIIE